MSENENSHLRIERPPEHPKLDDFPMAVKINVAWREMDAFGHVNNITYFRYFEDVRLAYFWELGFKDEKLFRNTPSIFSEDNIGPILASTSCEFERPLTFPDVLHVGGRVVGIEEERFRMNFLVVSEKHDSVAARGKATVFTYDYERGGLFLCRGSLGRRLRSWRVSLFSGFGFVSFCVWGCFDRLVLCNVLWC